jgi:hypothetical protein
MEHVIFAEDTENKTGKWLPRLIKNNIKKPICFKPSVDAFCALLNG